MTNRVKKIFKLILIAIFLAGAMGTVYFFLSKKEKSVSGPVAVARDPSFGWKFPTNLPSRTVFPPTAGSAKNLFDFEISYSTIRDPGGMPRGLPVRLKIPAIGVNAAVEDALITPDGRMDVPAGSVNVAWFSLGPNPGQVGSAVIGGHFGIRDGVKFVFYDLNKLVVGDKIYVENDKGVTLAFQVRRIELFDRNADATTVFISNDGLAHLNVITCEGIWNRVDGAYPSRRVVFTDAIAGEGPVVVAKPPLTTSPVPSVTKPALPTTAVTPAPAGGQAVEMPERASSSPQTFTTIVKSLFATPIDGLVTALLIISIIFVALKII